jgi:hypothetical protein
MAVFVIAGAAAWLAPPAGAQLPCDRLIEAALEAVGRGGLGSAGRLFLDARVRYPERWANSLRALNVSRKVKKFVVT